MISRIVTTVVIVAVVIATLLVAGFVRGRSRADEFMRHVDGNWARTQTRFLPFRHTAEATGPTWEFFYEPREREYRYSAPIMITASLFGRLPERITISARHAHEPVLLSDAIPISRDEAYSLSSPFWKQRYSITLRNTREEKTP
jgi:hypothetical protein